MTHRPSGPACGNNPNYRMSDGDRQAVDAFRAYLAARAALERVRTVLETEAVVGRTALEYRGLIASALMAGEAQPTQPQPAPYEQIADRLDIECARRVKAAWSPEEATTAREWGNVAAFVRGLAQQPTVPDGVVAYSPGGRTLRCLNCRPNPLGSDWRALTSSDLEDGGLCTVCGVDVLIGARP
ncbi:hypothetical protein [Streptomyces sp. NPDC003299]